MTSIHACLIPPIQSSIFTVTRLRSIHPLPLQRKRFPIYGPSFQLETQLQRPATRYFKQSTLRLYLGSPPQLSKTLPSSSQLSSSGLSLAVYRLTLVLLRTSQALRSQRSPSGTRLISTSTLMASSLFMSKIFTRNML